MPESSFKRTILITGSTDGIGKQTATDLAAHPDNRVIIHGRSEEKCEATREHIIKETGNPSNVECIACDLSIMKEVAHFADEVKSRFPDLNVLLCNAGVLNPRRAETKDGLEMTFQVNHLAHFVISRQLRPLLAKNAPSRIVFTSSICHDWYPLDFSDLQATKYGDPYLQYSRSKLMCHMTGLRMARDRSDGVTVNVLEPGVIETKLLKRGGYSGSPVKEGSVAPVHLATAEELKNVTGEYFNNRGKKIASHPMALDTANQDRLWKMSEEICAKFGITF